MIEPRHDGPGLIANRFKPIRMMRQNMLHARDGRRHVAIELVPAKDHDLDELRRAIAIANAIDHPNLCRPREVLEHADQLVIVTELVEGVSIRDRLVIGPFDPLQVGALMVELLSVLSRIHADGLAHGGISPNTVVIDAAGLLRLMDLGVVRGPNRPTARHDLEAVGALATTMLAGYVGAVPAPLLAWIARCSDPVHPFPDAAAAAAGLVTPDGTATEAPRTRTLSGMGQLMIPATPATPKTETESPAAIAVPTVDEPAVDESALRRGRTPAAMVKTSDALALAESTKPELAQPVVANPTRAERPDVAQPVVPNPRAERPDRASRFPLLVVGLGAAVVAVAVFVWRSKDGSEAPPSEVRVSQPLIPIEQPPAPALRPRPPLPTGAVNVPDDPVPATILAEPPPPRETPAPRPALPAGASASLEVMFSPDAVWIEKPGVYVLEEAYRQLLKHPRARVEIIGCSSDDGEEGRNTQLAIGRALVVKKYLVERGVDEGRIATASKANTKSRRAEIRILVP